MTEKTLTIEARVNTDVSPLAMLVQVASQYESSIHFRHGSKRVNAKSIMGMMSLGLNVGEELEVSAEGTDEVAAVDGIDNFLSGKLV